MTPDDIVTVEPSGFTQPNCDVVAVVGLNEPETDSADRAED
jgi:hypothetical protein